MSGDSFIEGVLCGKLRDLAFIIFCSNGGERLTPVMHHRKVMIGDHKEHLSILSSDLEETPYLWRSAWFTLWGFLVLRDLGQGNASFRNSTEIGHTVEL